MMETKWDAEIRREREREKERERVKINQNGKGGSERYSREWRKDKQREEEINTIIGGSEWTTE